VAEGLLLEVTRDTMHAVALCARLAYTSRGSCACATEAMMALAGLLVDYSCFFIKGFGREGFEGMQEGFELAARHQLLLSHLRAS
jgi:hypothetical protein